MTSSTGLGFLLRTLRDERRLSLSEVAELSKVDKAYIHRLESGEKTSPSEETVKKLRRVLKPDERRSEFLDYLVSHSNSHAALVEAALNDPGISLQAFAAADGASFRGAPLEPSELLRKMQEILNMSSNSG